MNSPVIVPVARRRWTISSPQAIEPSIVIPDVREGRLQGLEALLEAFAGRRHAGLGRVIDVIGGQQLVQDGEVAVVDDLERNPLGDQLDLGSHG
jgi:hypothetical protein